MNDLSKIRQAKGTTLPSLLARLIDAYECSPNRIIEVLRFNALQSSESDHPAQAPLETLDALVIGEQSSAEVVYRTSLHSPGIHLDRYRSLLKDWFDDNSWNLKDEITKDDVIFQDSDFELTKAELTERGDLFDNPHLERSIREQATDFDANPSLKTSLAKEWGVDPTLPSYDFVLRAYQKSNADARHRFFTSLKRPNELLLWAKELVGRLPSIVEKSLKFDEHVIAEMNGYVPQALVSVFEQANLCRIFDLEIPCVICCGTLIEEAIEIKFPKLAKSWKQREVEARKSISWRERAAQISEAFPGFENISGAIQRIVNARNRAVHDPDAYISRGNNQSETVLQDTRAVLSVLFGKVA